MILNKEPYSFVIAQLVVSLVFSALFLLYDWPAAYSALAGGLIATLANAWFTVKVFTVKRSNEPSVLLRAIYTGEIYKILLTGALFVVAFVLIRPVNAATLLATYFVVHMTPATAGFLLPADTNKNTEENN
jgi:ATP synthase protein I